MIVKISVVVVVVVLLLLLVVDPSRRHIFFCSAFAATSSSSSLSSVFSTASTTTLSSTTTNRGIPDPPPPVLEAKTKKKIPHRDINTPIPITVLSGFLGSGKTTLLQNILLNNDGLRIAVIVNDVASINIDSKLIQQQRRQQQRQPSQLSLEGDDDTAADIVTTPAFFSSSSSSSVITTTADTSAAAAAGILELQNGCACCSKSDELLMSIADMVTLNDMRDVSQQFDHIVIELSGIANPSNIRSMFHDAMLYQMPLMERIALDTMITVVDCSTILQYIHSSATANPIEAPELFTDNDIEQNNDPISDATDNLLNLFGNNIDSINRNDGSTNSYEEGVAELIISQIEISDIILMNKIDLLHNDKDDYQNTNEIETTYDDNDNDNNELNRITDILYALNPRANHIPTVYTNVPIITVLGAAKGQGIALTGILDDHKDAIQFASTSTTSTTTDTSKNTDTSTVCTDPVCTDPTHTHDHHHHHHHHHHDNSDQHSDRIASLSNNSTDDASCTSPTTCTNPTHSHDKHDSHHHHHDDTAPSTITTTSTQHAGIGSFVYRARRPFHPLRYHTFLHHLPIQRGLTPLLSSQKLSNNDNEESLLTIPPTTQQIMKQILRSKGFIWCADSNVAALYMSQAGSNLDISCLGSWWATLPRSQWPSEAVETVLQDFDSIHHIEGEDVDVDSNDITVSFSVGDRRQELVFIGTMLGTNKSYQNSIVNLLNQCLLNDTEYQQYCLSKNDEATLSKLFPSTLSIKQMN